jgi:hypothetical protein
MAIMVQYTDNSYGHVQNSVLDELINVGRIVAFRRTDGWVEIFSGRLRSSDASKDYEGTERRSVMTIRNCLICSDFVNSVCEIDTCPFRIALMGKIC